MIDEVFYLTINTKESLTQILLAGDIIWNATDYKIVAYMQSGKHVLLFGPVI